MAGRIFINYRRGDASEAAGRLYDHLESVFGAQEIFMDVDAIEPGLDFVRVLNDQVAQCDIFISVVGRSWVDALDENGARRLDNPDDFVRVEIESALRQDKRLIPVLVGQVQMPRSEQLPDAMKPFVRRNAVRLTHERFRADVQALIAALQRALKSAEEARAAKAQAVALALQRFEEEWVQQDVEASLRSEEEAHQQTAKAAAQEPQKVQYELEPQDLEEALQQAVQNTAEEGGLRDSGRSEERQLTPSGSAGRLLSLRGIFIGTSIGVVLLGAIGVIFEGLPTPAQRSPPSAPAAPVAQNPTFDPWPFPVNTTIVPITKRARPPATTAPARISDDPLSAQEELALWPKDTFRECSKCPVMMVVSAGSFTMGSPANEPGRFADEGPQHKVTIARQLAVGQFELTFDDWDACVADSGCNGYRPSDQGWGRGTRPVINVNWDDANAYVAWLAKKAGKPYRLLSEAEYEYATRAGITAAYPWGDAIGTDNANCKGCGSQWGGKQTAPVGSFAPNGFGLYGAVGNIWEWTEDCYHSSYSGAPMNGSAWTSGDCSRRVLRGGPWSYPSEYLRSAARIGVTTDLRYPDFGFRVGRTLLTP